MAGGECRLVMEERNTQLAWTNFTQLQSGLVRLQLDDATTAPHYNNGDLVGVKSKCCGKHHNAYDFMDGEDIVLEDVVWRRHSRGVMRRVNNMTVRRVELARESPAWCLGSSGGGPQLGQPGDPPVTGVTVQATPPIHT